MYMMLFKRLISEGLNGEVVSYQIRKSTMLIRVIQFSAENLVRHSRAGLFKRIEHSTIHVNTLEDSSIRQQPFKNSSMAREK